MSADEDDVQNPFHYLILFGIGYVLLVTIYFTQNRLARLCCRTKHPVDDSFENGETCCLQWQPQLHTSDTTCDERHYQSWNTGQVANWAHDKLTSVYNQQHQSMQFSPLLFWGSFNSRGIRKAIKALSIQCIDGQSLDHLTLQRMLSFGIPFGIAVHLNIAFDELVSNNSDIRRVNGYVTNGSRLRSDLVALPSWYEQASQLSTGAVLPATGNEEIDVEAQEHAHKMMQDRFGMNLPSLRENANNEATNNINAKSNTEPMRRMEPAELAEIMQMKPTITNQHNNASPQVDRPAYMERMLKNMPPHVRAIAERRPDFVSKLLTGMQAAQSSIQSSFEPVPEGDEEFQEHNEEVVGDDEVNYDTEMVGLLRRRTNNNR